MLADRRRLPIWEGLVGERRLWPRLLPRNTQVNAFFPCFSFFINHDKPVDMSGGNSVVGLRPRGAASPERHAEPIEIVIEESDFEVVDDDETVDPQRSRSDWLAMAAAFLISAAWLGLASYDWSMQLGSRLPDLAELVRFIGFVCPPLVLVMLGWLLYVRSSRTEQRRFRHTSDSIQREIRSLEATLSMLSARLDESRNTLAEQGQNLMGLGEDAASRLATIARSLEADIESIGKQTQALTGSAASARGDLAVLLANLPKANVQTRQMISALQEAGLTAHEKAGALDAQLALLTNRGREADEIAGNAAQKLAAHLSRMEGVSEVAGARMEKAAEQMTSAVDAALERAAQALQAAREGMEAQGAAMTAMVEQNHAAMAKSGADSAEELAKRVQSIASQIENVATTFSAQDEASKTLVARLHSDIDSIEQRFALLESGSVKRTDRLSNAVKALAGHADDLKVALAGGGDTANTLVEKVQSLMTALDAAAQEIDQTLPAAYARLSQRAEESMAMVTAATPVVSQLSETAAAALRQLQDSHALVLSQQETLAAMSDKSGAQLRESQESARELASTIASATADAERLSQSAAPQLVEALLRVRETASQASDHARTTLADIIPQSAKMLGDRTREAMADAMASEVEAQMARISACAETAVAAAKEATDALMRQMLTISETSAALEARIADARDEAERNDRANFARRVALLIESLNSTAIDVTKILSNEVTDTAWAAYLRGDRGVFARRAVKLLDAGEVREIARHYDADPEFHEQVNRYIHDFEAMLRNVLATREGSTLGVTLLSSDTGKLYVALAQAIERLRT